MSFTAGLSGGRAHVERQLLHLLRQGGEPLVPLTVPEPLELKALTDGADGPATFPLPGGFWEITMTPPKSGSFPLPRDANAVLLTRDEVERCRFRTPLPGDKIRLFRKLYPAFLF